VRLTIQVAFKEFWENNIKTTEKNHLRAKLIPLEMMMNAIETDYFSGPIGDCEKLLLLNITRLHLKQWERDGLNHNRC